MLALVDKGASREDAYRMVQRSAMRAWEGGGDFRALLQADPEVAGKLAGAELDACFDLGYHLKHVDTIFQRVFAKE
jgi:adenylosuccinate lyase